MHLFIKKIYTMEGDMRFIKPESLTKDSIILDVRGSEEYAQERLELPHILIKADEVNPDKFMAQYNPQGDKTINILCTSGGLASEVAEKFEEAGYSNVAVVVGGIIEAEYEGVRVLKN
jgi:rhodanese-related sulfurtransferase